MPSPPDARPLEPVAAVPAHELVLAQLRRSIHLGHFGAGDRLPPERELARQLGVSRTTVREAVRVLEGEGLVEIKRGSSGGISVRPQSPGAGGAAAAGCASSRRSSSSASRSSRWRRASPRSGAPKTDLAALDRDLRVARGAGRDGRRGRSLRLGARRRRVPPADRADVAQPAAAGAPSRRRARACSCRSAPSSAGSSRAPTTCTPSSTTAIVAGDADRAGAAMTAHVEATLADVRALVRR